MGTNGLVREDFGCDYKQPKSFLDFLKPQKMHHTRTFLHSQQGFTLLELMVAISLLAIGVFAVLGMNSVAMKSNTEAHQLSVATSLGQQVLEDILSWDRSDSRINPTPPSGGFAYYPDPQNPANAYIAIPGAGTFTPTWTRIFPTGGNGVPAGSVMIRVTITFGNNNRTINLTGFKRLL